MNDNRYYESGYEGPEKYEWVIHRLAIKNGSVIRAALRLELYVKPLPWSFVEGVERA